MSLFSPIGSADLAARINSRDWTSTALGPSEDWPLSLRTSLGIILGSRFPMQLLWGPTYIHFYNDAYILIAGDKHPAALGRPGAEVWPEIWHQVLPNLERVRSTGEPSWSDDELLMLHRNGMFEESYFTFSYSPVHDASGVGGVFVAVTETTRRVIGERRLHTTRDLAMSLAGLVDESAVLSAAKDVFARNLQDLPFALCYTVEGPGQPYRLAWESGVPQGHAAAADIIGFPGAHWPIPSAQQNGTPRLIDLPATGMTPLLAADWDTPITLACVLPLHPPGLGPEHGCLVIGISPRLRLDGSYLEFLERLAAQLSGAIVGARSYAQANQAVRARDDFLSIAAHELKTPLTPIVGRLQLTRRQLAREGIAQRHLDNLDGIANEASRLADLIDVLLDVTQLRSGQLRLARQIIDLADLTALVAAEFQSSFATHVFSISRLNSPALVNGDAVRLGQVIRNLLSNAVKYSPGGGTIQIEVASAATALTLSVADQGVGIDPQLIARIFERYYRVDTVASSGIGGLGIGLFIVQEIVRLHGGSINVESELGVGSRFIVTLPAEHHPHRNA